MLNSICKFSWSRSLFIRMFELRVFCDSLTANHEVFYEIMKWCMKFSPKNWWNSVCLSRLEKKYRLCALEVLMNEKAREARNISYFILIFPKFDGNADLNTNVPHIIVYKMTPFCPFLEFGVVFEWPVYKTIPCPDTVEPAFKEIFGILKYSVGKKKLVSTFLNFFNAFHYHVYMYYERKNTVIQWLS